ncbi:MAG: thioredoxin domain-containing protein [Nanoarchaeota archaeon]
MVLCFIALPIFALLGIFSVRYRRLAADAIDCAFRTLTLRKCRSNLDERIKSAIAGKAMKVSPGLAKFFYHNYVVLSWVLVAIFIWSTIVSGIGVYNYALYGNCNGPADTGFCVFDPTGQNTGISETDVDRQQEIIYPELDDDDPMFGNPDAELTIIQFGCYSCPFTKKAEENIEEVLDYYDGRVNLQFKTFIIPTHSFAQEAAEAADCAIVQGKYAPFHKALMRYEGPFNMQVLDDLASDAGIDLEQLHDCMDAGITKNEVDSDSLQGMRAGVYGTPTFFINEQVIVGPKPFRTFKTIIDSELS